MTNRFKKKNDFDLTDDQKMQMEMRYIYTHYVGKD